MGESTQRQMLNVQNDEREPEGVSDGGHLTKHRGCAFVESVKKNVSEGRCRLG
jgi:hypothetical protein